MNDGPVWINENIVIAVHARQIAEHGGNPGIRDKLLLSSSLARPRQRYVYGDPTPDLADLAASLAYGIARNHPFVDGNKRTAAVLCELFITLNGAGLEASDQEMLSVFLALAEGSLDEDELAGWIRTHIKDSL